MNLTALTALLDDIHQALHRHLPTIFISQPPTPSHATATPPPPSTHSADQLLTTTQAMSITPAPTDRTGLATIREAKDFLRISTPTLYRLMNAGTIPFKKLGRSRRISWPFLHSFIATTTTTP